jgi:hypothetical protein
MDEILGYSASQSAQGPAFGPYNVLMCRSGKIASFPLNTSISQDGLVVAFDFYPYSGGPMIQTIFSIRDKSTNFISLRLDYLLSPGTINIWGYPLTRSPSYLLDSTTAANLSITTGKFLCLK